MTIGYEQSLLRANNAVPLKLSLACPPDLKGERFQYEKTNLRQVDQIVIQ